MDGIKYVTVQGWMSDGLGLEKSTLFVFATIYSFSQGVNICTLGNGEIADFWNISEKTVRRAKAELLEKGLITQAEGGIMANKPEGLIDVTESEAEDEPFRLNTPSVNASGAASFPKGDAEFKDEPFRLNDRDKMSDNSDENEGGQNVQADKMSEDTDKMSTKADKMSEDNLIKINNKINIYNTHTNAGAGACEEIIDQWFKHKLSRGEPPKNEDAKKTIEEIREYAEKFGAEAVRAVIEYSIERHYPALYWDRIEKPSQPLRGSSPGGRAGVKESIFSSDASYDLQRYARLGLENFDILED